MRTGTTILLVANGFSELARKSDLSKGLIRFEVGEDFRDRTLWASLVSGDDVMVSLLGFRRKIDVVSVDHN